MLTNNQLPPACPVCKEELKRATMPDQKPVEPGDFAVCMNCAQLLVYEQKGKKLQVRSLTDREWAGFPPEIYTGLMKVKQKALYHILTKVSNF